MKKLFYSTFIFAALLTSCGEGEKETEKDGEDETESHETPSETIIETSSTTEVSSVGNWSTADKEKADAAIAAIDAELAAFGDKKQDFIDCYLEKVENTYSNFTDADSDLEGCSSLAESCATEVMGL